MPAPFNTADIARCEKLNKQLMDTAATGEERSLGAYIMQPVEYVTGGVIGKHIDVSEDSRTRENELKSLIFSTEERDKLPASCKIHGSNWKLEKALNDFGKPGGLEQAVFEIDLHKNEVFHTDIPVNLASCNSDAAERIAHLTSLAFTPKNCHIDSIHAHNSRDVNPAIHLHVKCWDVEDSTLNWLRTLVKNANDVGYEMCVGRMGTAEMKSRAKQFGVCLDKCEKKYAKKKSRQTRFEIMGGR